MWLAGSCAALGDCAQEVSQKRIVWPHLQLHSPQACFFMLTSMRGFKDVYTDMCTEAACNLTSDAAGMQLITACIDN